MTSNLDHSHHHQHHHDHLRHLLDQRAARADLHTRFPSQSDISDSPSVYSHGPFSPHPHDTHSTPSTSFHYTLSVHDHPHSSGDVRSPGSDRERLNNYPDASSLDLDDDPRSSFDQQSIRTSIRDLRDSDSEDGLEAEIANQEQEVHRVSMYGPKMTVHSRAPWEMEDEEEPSRSRKKKAGDKTPKTDASKRPWGLTPRSSGETRPSVDSVRSLSRSKQSFDTMSSLSSNSGGGGGAIFALAQASFSSTSVAITPSPQSTLRDKLSIPRLRSRTASSAKATKLDPLDTRSITPSLYSVSAQTSPVSRYRATSPIESFSHADPRMFTASVSPPPFTPDRSQEYRHPYANPDFARATPSPAQLNRQLEELHSLAHSSSYVSTLGPSESNVTLTDAFSTGGISQASSGSTISLTPVPSAVSPQPKSDHRPMQGRSPSAPINKAAIRAISHNAAADSSVLAVNPPSVMPGWTDNSSSSIKLISLEEAQAQARERSRSATANGSNVVSPTVPRFNDEPLSSPTSQTWSSRIRSTSANSTKMKVSVLDQGPPPLPSFPSEQVVPQRTVVRKKSGFMRLFNGKERASPPPMPSMSSTSLPSPSSSSSIPVSSRRAPQRVPVPAISPTSSESSDGGEWIPEQNGGNSQSSQSTVRGQLSIRRNAPELSIVTSSSSPSDINQRPAGRSVSPCASDGTHVGTSVTPTTATTNTDSYSYLDGSIPPDSAPSNSADFLGFRLRPVSTMFSTDFAGHLVRRGSSGQSRPSLDTDSGTPTTSSGVSPLSSGFSMNLEHPGDEKSIVSIASHQDDQSAVIQALQEQIMIARRAWQRQIWELEGQVRDLKAEVEEFRGAENARDYCTACGRGNAGRPPADTEVVGVEDLKKAGVKVGGVVNRPRARTGVGSRFASAT